MSQDINNIIDNLNAEWAQDLAAAKRKVAIFVEEIRVLKARVEQLEQENAELKAKIEEKGEGVSNEYPSNKH